MDTETARFNMIEQQIRPWNVLDPKVLSTLGKIKREHFVPKAYQALAFADVEIPLGTPDAQQEALYKGQIMLPPRVDARLLQATEPGSDDRVLEIGTGSGFMSALLSMHAKQVLSIEIDANLAQIARKNLEQAKITNVEVKTGDAFATGQIKDDFDVIVLSGAVPILPQTLLQRLAVKGRMVAIVGNMPLMQAQQIICHAPGELSVHNLFETVAPTLLNAPNEDTFEF